MLAVQAQVLPHTQAQICIWRLAVAVAVPVVAVVLPTVSVLVAAAVAVVAVVAVEPQVTPRLRGTPVPLINTTMPELKAAMEV